MAVIGEVLKDVEAFHPEIQLLLQEIRKRVIGQEQMINRVLVGLFANGHILLEGVPGLAKTTLVDAIAKALDLDFKRVQFTPDLLPADIIGTMVYDSKSLNFLVKKGPIFTNILLADEINRAPSKVQSALLEAMQERQVTIGETSYQLDKPFLVLATQNPIEQGGTYQLPEAQLDRFMLKIKVDYPSKEEEIKIVDMMMEKSLTEIFKAFDKEKIDRAQTIVKDIYIADKLTGYIVDLINATRFPAKYDLANLENYISFGASPRASINLVLAAKAHSLIKGRAYVIPDDIKALAYDVLRHRIILTYEAEAEGVKVEDVISEILDKIEVP